MSHRYTFLPLLLILACRDTLIDVDSECAQ
jgi:hypothetical protein